MPIVYVHGVATRQTDAYEQEQAQRTSLFRAVLGPALSASASTLEVLNPYWGGSASRFAWNHASLPPGETTEKFGGVDTMLAEALAGQDMTGSTGRAPLVSLARKSLTDVVDLLWAVGMDRAGPEEAEALAHLAARAVALAERRPAFAWLAEDMTDEQLFDRILDEVTDAEPALSGTAVESFGSARPAESRIAVWRLREAVARIGSAAPRAASTAAVFLLRGSMHAQGSMFLGDVLTYVHQREQAGADAPIAKAISADVEKGARLRDDADSRLVVIAHSMGGNIVYDLFSHLRPDLECDLLVTVGSQVGVFAELGLFPAVAAPADPAVDRVPALPNVRRWINVYDPDDTLAFLTGGIFEGSEDFQYSTGRGLLRSHSTYLLRPSFHHRLAQRIRAYPGPSLQPPQG